MPPNPGQQSTDANETVVTRVKDYPAESGSVDLVPVSVATAPSATPVPPTANVINSRAGPVAKGEFLPSLIIRPTSIWSLDYPTCMSCPFVYIDFSWQII